MKIIKRSFQILLILLILLGIGIFLWLQNLKPDYNAEHQLPNLKDQVEVLYDDYGIPHIYAQNEEDLFYAFGYVHAQDRLFQMEMVRRLADGRLSEIFGRPALESDKFFRTLSFRHYAKITLDSVYHKNPNTPFTKAAKAYLRGVNEYVKNGKTPVEFSIAGITKTDFTLEDIEIISGYMGFTFAEAFRNEALATMIHTKFGDDYLKDVMTQWQTGEPMIPVNSSPAATLLLREKLSSKIANPTLKSGLHGSISGTQTALTLGKMANQLQQLEAGLAYPTFHGSNGWLISGSKTKSGKPILSNDTHIAFSQPSVWYEAHLVCPNFNFYGNFLAGTPVGALGHNEHGGWGLTMFENDDVDFFREKANAQNPKQVWFKDHWENMKIREEKIKVKDEADVVLAVKESRHGIILNEAFKDVQKEQEPIALWWTFYKFPDRGLQAFYDLAHAHNATQAGKAASLLHAPGLNIMWADNAGNIAWWAAAKLPKRPAHVNSGLILDGSTGNDDPIGWLDFSQNPQISNPAKGVLYTANNQPDNMGTGYVPGYYVPGDRAKRIEQLIFTPKNDWTETEVRKVINDNTSANYPVLLKDILPIINQKDLNESAKNAFQKLVAWDGSHPLEAIEPTIFYRFLYRVYDNTFRDELGDELFQSFTSNVSMKRNLAALFRNDASRWWDNVKTPNKETRAEILSKSFAQATADLETQLGKETANWQWQKVHTLTHKHPLGILPVIGKYFNVGALPAPGGRETINNLDFSLDSTGRYEVQYGPALRRIINFASPENGTSINPTGQSGYFLSKHYQDQAQMYVKGEARKELMNRKDIEAVKTGRMVLH
jgi:penicillin G amidase